jgi:hypothetical protein
MSIRELVDHILADGVITLDEQKSLNEAILQDDMVIPEEREQIERIWELLKSGKIKAS